MKIDAIRTTTTANNKSMHDIILIDFCLDFMYSNVSTGWNSIAFDISKTFILIPPYYQPICFRNTDSDNFFKYLSI